MGIELEPNQGGCYEARLAGCTCAWLRGFGVGLDPVVWAERILLPDDECSVHRQKED